MFEGVIAGVLNRFLGKYVQDLDTENLNVGIFSGNVNLTDLKLKPEALYELNLPIDVKIGTIGQISFQIPWTGLYTQPVIVNIQDVLILVGPAISNNFFDSDREKLLIRAAKKKILQDLESDGEILGGPQNFFENLLTTIVNNVQIFVRNVHIRYEDTLSCKDGSFACGLCLQSLSIETTNNKWKPSITPQGSNTVYQMMKVESLSFYWNPSAVVLDDEETRSITQTQFFSWRHYMISGLEKFSMHKEDFEFLLKPVTCKVKVIINRSGEARVPRLLVDAVLQDSAAQVSRKQYLSACALVDSFKRIAVNRKYRHLHPKVPVNQNSKKWWKYIYNAVLEQRIKPYTWQTIKSHRDNYHKYKDAYKNTLRSPNDTELKLDLQKCEDNLAILSVIIAREHAKIELQVEEPDRVEVKESEIDWWRVSTPSPIQDLEPSEDGFARKNVDLCVKPEKVKGLWTHLSSPEKQRVCELIGYVDGGAKPDKPKLYIEHKINLTLANSSLSLMNRGREVLVLTLTQFLASIETRPAAKAFKVSARAESIVIEGANAENELAPMVTADNVYSGTTNTNFLSIDFEKNPLNSEADFGLNCSLEPVEVVYNEHAISEIINFFQTRSLAMKDVADILSDKLNEAAKLSKSLLSYTIARRKVVNINMDLKGPYIILPESGSLHKGGNVLVVDLGRVVIKSDLQPSNNQLEDATCMELEERLYDRLHADCSSLQVFFCDSGDEWRNARKLADSDLHLVPKIRVQLVFSNSIKQDYKLLPKHKLNVSISSLKLNLSDRRIGHLMDFFDNLPLPTSNTVPISFMDSSHGNDAVDSSATVRLLKRDKISPELKFKQLAALKRKLVLAYLHRSRAKETGYDKGSAKLSFLDSDRSFVSVEHSDDDAEIWARTVDLPGFDDNVSPNNSISVLLRFVIGEAVLHLSRSLDSVERPYMMLRLGKLCVDIAVMRYGPALQISLQSLMLCDKLHPGVSGEYLELITTEATEEFANVLYRKVRADCPDFKSHFHSVEQSLVVDIGNATVVFHREAWQTLLKYLEYIFQKVQSRDALQLKKMIKPHTENMMDLLNGSAKDPPIPPGATKFSYSFRLSQLRCKLSHSDVEILDIKLGGLESDCVFKANERMILKVFLNTFTVDDLSEMTLYSKMVWVDEDKVFEMKYVRHSPRVYRGAGKDSLTECDDVKSDGSLRIYVGRLHIVMLYKIMIDLQHFIEPFIPTGVTNEAMRNAEKGVENQLSNVKSWQTRLHISIDVHAPVFLLPQKSTSPNLIVFNAGDFTVENFFKEIGQSVVNKAPTVSLGSSNFSPVIDNILIKLDSVTLSRAVMTLSATLEAQEPILEPVSIRFDIKRAVGYHSIITTQQAPGSGAYNKDILLYDVDAVMDTINVNLGQRDLSTLLAVWTDNFSEGQYVGSMGIMAGGSGSPVETTVNTDASVKKLQAFFAQAESLRKEAFFRFTLDGVELKIFNDMDEVLSSPVRDSNRGLAKLAAGELSVNLDYFSDRSLDVKASLQSLLIEDIRPDTSIVIKKMFQSHAGEMRVDCSAISVSSPPIIDMTFRQNQAGDRNIDIHVEKTRMNFSVPFFMNLGRFVLDALPGDKSMEGGVINHGYVGDTTQQKQENIPGNNNSCKMRPPSSADSTSGYFSTGTSLSEDSPGLSVSIQFRKPEIMFFSDLSKTAGHALLFRTEILIDYSRHAYRENSIISFSGLQIMSKLQSKLKTTQPYLVLHPCDIELAKSFKNIEEGVIVTASISPIDMHLSETTVHTLTDIIEDIIADLSIPDEREPFNFLNYSSKASEKLEGEDLWSPKKIAPYVTINEEQYSYTQPNYPSTKPSETFTMAIPSIRIMFEIEAKSRIPVLMLKSVVEVSVHDWSKQMHSKFEINLQASYYNEKVDTWEPLLEPIVCEENVYRPWELLIKVFQAKSYPISSKFEHDQSLIDGMDGDRSNKLRQVSVQKKNDSESETSADENDVNENGMTFIRQRSGSKAETDGSNIVNGDDYYISSLRSASDSENEDGVMEKLASAIGHLFTGDSSDGENSESDDSSGAEPSGIESEHNSDHEASTQTAVKFKKSPLKVSMIDGPSEQKSTVNLNFAMKAESVDSGLETENTVDKTATYIMIDSRDKINITLTPQSMQVLYDLATHFTQRTMLVTDYQNVMAIGYEAPINLINDIGPGSKVNLVSHAEVDLSGDGFVLATANYDNDESCPSSPANSNDGRHLSSSGSDHDWETFEGGFNCEMRTPTPQPMFSPTLSFPMDPVSQLYKKVTDERLIIKTDDFEDLTIVCPQRTVNKLHVLQPSKNNTRYYIMLNTDSKYKNRKIVLRSPLQIRNETSYAIGLFYRKADLEANKIDLIGEQTNPFEGTMRIHILEPDETYNVPLFVAYHCKLYLQPTYVDNYHVTAHGLWWQELSIDLNTSSNLCCLPKDEKDPTAFSLRVLTTEGCRTNKTSHTIPNYLIRLLPPLTIHNRLPYAVETKIPAIAYQVRIEAGEKTNIYHINTFKTHRVSVEVNYLGLPWSGSFNLNSDLEEKTLTMTTDCDTDGGNKQLGLSLKVDRTESCELFLHAPYWIINKTGLPLQLRGSLSDVVYECVGSEPLLFHYRRSMRRRRVRLRVYQSSWSSAFGLETVGASGLVICKHRERNRRYRILMTVSLSQLCPQLTRIITLLPYFLVTNDTKKYLRFMEENERADLWIDLAPSQCVAFWPETDSMKLHCKFRDSSLVSQHFSITTQHSTVLRMDKGSALCVEVAGGIDKPFTVTFRPYRQGDSPVRIDNLCEDIFLKLNQTESGQVALLSPNQSTLYTWDDPTKERVLLWNVYNNKGKGFRADFYKDGYGEEKVSFHTVKHTTLIAANSVTSKLSSTLKKLTPKSPELESSSSEDSDCPEVPKTPSKTNKTRKDKVIVYWVSYLENFQRVFMLTQEERIAYMYRQKIDSEKCNYETFLSLSGLGLSVCMQTNMGIKELSYVSLTDSPTKWEVNVAHKWKLLTVDLTSWIEEKFKSDQKKCQLKEYIHIDFEKMQMTKPFFGELRRTYNPALWLQSRKSDNQLYTHIKLHRIQIDNQLYEAVFPSVLYPAPLLPHIAKKIGTRPCVEYISLKRNRPYCNQDVYKYVKLLVQEFCIQLDRGFVNYIFDILNQWTVEERPSLRLRADLALVHVPITSIAAKHISENCKSTIVEFMHLSPVKVQLSLSSRGYSKENSVSSPTKGSSKKENRPKLFNSDLLEFLFNSWSSCLTEMKGVKLKMAYFEITGKTTSVSQLFADVYQHYYTQLIQQFYVLVLGLDILGNPYGKISDFTRGLGDFFYEPFLGIPEGPEEVANRLAFGAYSLFGHSVGGVAKNSSLIAQSLGELTNTICFDDEYKKKRRYGYCLQKSSDLPESLILAGQTYIMGVTLGLSGIIMKPIFDDECLLPEGGRNECVEGVVRGCGGAVVAAGARAGGAGATSLALDALRRAAERGRPVILRARLPRYCHPYEGVKPYSAYQALGLRLLASLGRGHYVDTDLYLAHAALTPSAKITLLLTMQHVFLVRTGNSGSPWQVEWALRMDDVIGVPTIKENKLIFTVKQDDNVNYFSSDERIIECEDMEVLKWLQAKVESALILNMEDKQCPSQV